MFHSFVCIDQCFDITNHALKMYIFNTSCQRVTLEPLDGKTWFQAHIVELHKCYRLVLESWESIQGNQNVPLSARGTFSSACG